MPTIINAKLNNLSNLYSITIQDNFFSQISLQQRWIRPLHTVKVYDLEECENINLLGMDALIDAKGYTLVPALIDAHVHSRDPGGEAKEDWESLTKCAYKGGCVAVCDMPNTNPPTLDVDSLMLKIQRSQKSSLEKKFFLGVSEKNLKFLKDILHDASKYNICGLKVYYGHSTGNLGFSNLSILKEYLPSNFSLPICFHAEDQNVIDGNLQIFKNFHIKNKSGFVIHSRIRSVKSAVEALIKILNWAKGNNFKIHIAHVSSYEEIKLIRKAKYSGMNISAEITPHHLIFNCDDYGLYGGFLKVNPPVRDIHEAYKLRKYLARGYFDIIATDHAPHLFDEKNTLDYLSCPSGIPSIEFLMPLVFKISSLCNADPFNILRLASINPARRFGFKHIGKIAKGYKANFVWVKFLEHIPKQILSKCGWSIYDRTYIPIEVKACWHNGVRRYYSSNE